VVTSFFCDDAIALRAVDSFVFTCFRMLLEVLSQHLRAAAVVLADAFHKLAVFPVTLNLIVGARLCTAGRRVHALKAELSKLRHQVRMRVVHLEGLSATIGAKNLALGGLQSLSVLIDAGLAEALAASTALNRVEQKVVADFALEKLVCTRHIGLDELLLHRVTSLKCFQRLVLSLKAFIKTQAFCFIVDLLFELG